MKLKLTILLTLVSIVPSLSYSQKDSICFGYEDARHILKLANKGQALDSLVIHYDNVVKDQSEQIEIRTHQLKLSGELITEQIAQINKLTSDLEKSERNRILFKRICIGLGTVVLIETLIILI
jgi:hypothetical protein